MNLYDNKLWRSDLDEVIHSLPELQELSGKSIMITGCTGLICSAIVYVIARWNETNGERIKLYAAGRNENRIIERFSSFKDKSWFEYVTFDSSSSELGKDLNVYCDYIIHGASNASPNKIVKEPVETMMSNFIGTRNLLEFAKKKGTKRLLFISSSEVYGRKDHNRPSKIDEYGWIDILNPRSSYSIGKCAAETLCASYYAEYGVQSVIVRPGHIYGPTAVTSDNRVSSEWAYNVAKGQDIVMKSEGTQIRSYCYCLDCASAIVKVLLHGEPVHAYNISNPQSIISIRTMAELLVNTSGTVLKIELPTENERKGFNPMTNSSLDSKELLELGWKGMFDATRGFEHTVQIIKELLE